MPTTISKKSLNTIILVVAVMVVAFIGYKIWKSQQSALPKGIASGNGRLEAKQVDIATKEPLRVKEILVKEGDLVEPNQVLVRMDTDTLQAQFAEAKAKVELAKIELERVHKLLAENAASQREYDIRKTLLETSQAEAKALQTRIDDGILKSPVRGRVLYRLAEIGEVLGAGGKALTLTNLEDVYMEIFLPSEQAARLKNGAEARFTLDFVPVKVAFPGYVSFVSPEAQFTPKQVETKSERDKLMFRVKIQAPQELVSAFIGRVKVGVRGVGYVKMDESAVWPSWLQNLIKPEDAKKLEPVYDNSKTATK